MTTQDETLRALWAEWLAGWHRVEELRDWVPAFGTEAHRTWDRLYHAAVQALVLLEGRIAAVDAEGYAGLAIKLRVAARDEIGAETDMAVLAAARRDADRLAGEALQ